MSTTRRTFLKGTAATAAALSAPAILGKAAAADPIKLVSILDQSGGLDIYGRPMVAATEMAVAEINEAGGLLGRQVDLTMYDPQSTIQLYTQYATQAAASDRADVVHAGITSASREAIRPTLGRFQTLYFYNVQYEGGVCDRNVFCTGSTPAHTVEKLVPHVMKKWGKKVYIVAADYNYGQIIADWVQKFVKEQGGETVAVEFFPLDVTNFGPTIQKIQAADPDLVWSALVGGAHISFYRQYAAAGMKGNIPVASTTFGLGNEHQSISAEEGNGMLTSYTYFQELDNPVNQAFVKRFQERNGGADAPYLNELAVRSYEGIHLWAEGVKKAGTLDRMAVIEALETPVSYNGPSGTIAIEPKSHHATLNAYIAEVQDQKFNVIESFPDQDPKDTMLVCDLEKNPTEAKFYFENGLKAAGIE
ncbi:ABC transporter substrate-binding protein [Minwuia sp.]|uniref:urea ABC transporter substrate-binding protein n=1 Tax=Minwuia sp. TaxID=2493630 RepID=UPI003A95DABA